MSELKATPGPWELSPLQPTELDVYAKGEVICTVWLAECQQANAHLIAAAPEMYEALQAFIDNSSCQVNFPHECEAAEAVLQKARGEA